MIQNAIKEKSPAGALADMASAVGAWLRGEMGAREVHVECLSKLSGGAIQDNFMLDVVVDGGSWHGAHEFVLRSDPSSGVAASLSRAQEFAVLKAVYRAGVTTPEPLFLCPDRSVIQREFFIMRRLPGIAAGHRLTREPLLVPDRAALAEALGANLARVHAIRPGDVDLAALPPSREYHAKSTIAEYRAYLDQLEDAYPALEWALRWCERHTPPPSSPVLIHRDYRTGNYLVDDGRLTGVLDWEFAGWGEGNEDIGWFTARCWRFAMVDREAGGIAELEPFLRGYERISRRRISRADLDYWQAMAHLRWAIVALQQAHRHVVGGKRSLELALTGRIVHELEYELLQLMAGSGR